jgi:3-dehydroquinate synthase II
MKKEKEVWIDCTKDDLEEMAIRYNATGIIGDSKKGIKSFPDFYEAIIKCKEDIVKITEYRDKVPYILLNFPDQKVIPLEEILGTFQKSSTKVAIRTNDISYLETFKGALERGVDAFIVDDPKVIENFCNALSPSLELELNYAEITDIKNVEVGKRVCVNTIMSFKPREGILIGCSPSFMFLADAETDKENPYINPRDWRVNAGVACHYTFVPSDDPKKPGFGPKYLDDIKSGDRVMAVDANGKTRYIHVASTKTEKRSLTFIKAKYGKLEGAVYQQTAETVRLVSENSSIPVTQLKKGDKLKVYISNSMASHIGQKIDEFISER